MIVGDVKCLPSPPRDRNPSQAPAAHPGGGFAAFVAGSDGPGSTSSDYSQLQGRPTATSFAAMPIVAPAAVAPPTPEAETATPPGPPHLACLLPLADSVSGGKDESVTAQQAAGNRDRAPASDEAIEASSSAKAMGAGPSAASPPPASAPPRPVEAGHARLAKSERARGPLALPDVPAFDHGASSTLMVNVALGEAQPRILIRGARVGADDRSETAARIVRLMREHGYRISEQSIDFEGGTK